MVHLLSMIQAHHHLWRRAGVLLALIALVLVAGPRRAAAQPQPSPPPEIGVEERLGTTIDLDVTLVDEQGEPVVLRELVDRPTLLVFVYYRCPAICDPLLRELARNLDQLDMVAGTDYRVVTISFDESETAAVARTKKEEILGTMAEPPPPEGWRFLTGPKSAVRPLTDAVGFKYQYDAETQSFIHASSLIFLTSEGKIVRYIGGLEFLPAQLELALYDAAEGKERSVMRSLERLCYAYDPEGRTYVLQVNRLILGLTLLFVLVFVAYLLRRRRSSPSEDEAHG